jgi:hypothetical protein
MNDLASRINPHDTTTLQFMTSEEEFEREVIKKTDKTPSVSIRYTLTEKDVADKVEESLKKFFAIIQDKVRMTELEEHLKDKLSQKMLKFARSTKLFGGHIVIGGSDPQSVLDAESEELAAKAVVGILRNIATVDSTGKPRTIVVDVQRMGRSVLASTTMGGARQTEEHICFSATHSEAGSLSNVAHEMCHVVDFYHKGNKKTQENSKYVPYVVGDWFSKLELQRAGQ